MEQSLKRQGRSRLCQRFAVACCGVGVEWSSPNFPLLVQRLKCLNLVPPMGLTLNPTMHCVAGATRRKGQRQTVRPLTALRSSSFFKVNGSRTSW